MTRTALQALLLVAVTAAGTEVVHSDALGTFQAFVDFLKAGGPLATAVISAYWALRKDNEKRELEKEIAEERKAIYTQLVALISAHNTSMSELRGAVGALKDAIERLILWEQNSPKGHSPSRMGG